MSEMEPYQVMPDLDGDEFDRLKQDIEENGVEYPIIVNGDGDVIDGHHRRKAWIELGHDPGDLPKRIVDEPETDNYHRAYRANLLRRDLADGTKRTVVKQYLLEHPERVEEDTEREIAADLGVSKGTVQNAKEDLEENGKLDKVVQIPIGEKKELVRNYLSNHPKAGNREIADNVECDVSYRTVGNWRNKWSDDKNDTEESDSGPTGLDVFTTTKKDGEGTLDLISESRSGDEEAEKQLEKVSRGENTVDSAQRAVERNRRNKERRDDVPEIPDDEYSVILADPPWESTQVSHDREIENHYRTMSLSEIKEMDIPAADESVLYLWTTGPKLEESVEVLNEWGFTYTTCAVWDKQKIGLGYWFRNQHELILIGKRGGFSPPAQEDRVSSVISAERGEHSEKPDELHEIVESAFPDHEKIELFARNPRDGWDSWGDEV